MNKLSLDDAKRLLARSTPDSRRFGMNVARARLGTVISKDLAGELLASDIDVAIIRVPAGHSSGIHELCNWALPVIHADTLVYYKCDLKKYEPPALRNHDISFTLAGMSDAEELRSLILSTFDGYISHYHANPLFAADDVLDGYVEWATGHLSSETHMLWAARRGNRIVAFAACQWNDEATFEGVLYGVCPDEAGGGLYGDLIRYTQTHAKRNGAKVMTVSTQVNNHAVQKVWSREGFHMHEAWNTFHINALMTHGKIIKQSRIIFTSDDIRRFAEVTGDMNPLHLDSLAAAASGLPAPIAHGVMTLGEISRVLGMETPGEGTIILHMDVAYLRPIIANQGYHLTMREIRKSEAHHPFKVIATIRAESGECCIVARADVVLKR